MAVPPVLFAGLAAVFWLGMERRPGSELDSVLVTLVTLLVVRASGAVSSASTFAVPVIWVAFVAAVGNDVWGLWRSRQTPVSPGK